MPTDPAQSSSRSASIGCLILAAGGSRRLGQAKQLVTFQNHTLLERTVAAALAVPALWPVVVVIGAEASRIRPALARHPVLIAENPAWTEGIASSLRCGLDLLEQFNPAISATLVTLCDQPHISAEVFEQLVATHEQTGATLVAARYDHHPGAPALFDRSYFKALASLTGDEGARILFKSLPAEAIRTVDLPELSLDIDTPEDLAKLDPLQRSPKNGSA